MQRDKDILRNLVISQGSFEKKKRQSVNCIIEDVMKTSNQISFF